MNQPKLSDIDKASFARDGYIVVPGLADESVCAGLQSVAEDHLATQLAPIEYEVDVKYPGSPSSVDAEGGQTARRLLNAYTRHGVFRDWSTSESVASYLHALFNSMDVTLSQCHHNCVMTKHPGFSSATLWHQDNRYWNFDQQNLISVWLALGTETKDNGCLRVIPGTHNMSFDPGRFDAALFLRPDLPENKALMSKAVRVELNRGDVLFFHSRLFHAAGRNLTDQTKFSVVFTYHESSNHPIEGTRSARFPGVPLPRD